MLGGTEMIGDMYGTSQHSPQDVMYFLVEGEAIVSLPDGAVTMREGDVVCIAAGTPSLLPVEVTAPGLTSCSRIAK